MVRSLRPLLQMYIFFFFPRTSSTPKTEPASGEEASQVATVALGYLCLRVVEVKEEWRRTIIFSSFSP